MWFRSATVVIEAELHFHWLDRELDTLKFVIYRSDYKISFYCYRKMLGYYSAAFRCKMYMVNKMSPILWY